MPGRPCWVEISTQSLEDNYRLLSTACSGGETEAPVELLAIVKADAYGHSLALCAPASVRAGAHWLGVTSVEEGAAARVLCDGFRETEILVIGGVFPGQGAFVIKHGLTAVVWDLAQLDELEAAARVAGCAPGTAPVHLELDTGMSRQGVSSGDLNAILARFHAPTALRLDGLMTHLYAADESDGGTTRAQFAQLRPQVEQVLAAGLRPTWLHVGNSAAVLSVSTLAELRALANQFGMKPMARPGLALYGLAPVFTPDEPPRATAIQANLRRVLSWKTRVVSVRTIPAGATVGYNGTFVATEPMRLALLAVGYGDGLKRALSNRGAVLIGGRRAPIVGRISMDQAVVDVTEIPAVRPGNEAVLIGSQGANEITAEDHAAWAGTVPWEIFTSITARVGRFATDRRPTSR